MSHDYKANCHDYPSLLWDYIRDSSNYVDKMFSLLKRVSYNYLTEMKFILSYFFIHEGKEQSFLEWNLHNYKKILAIYGPMIYTALSVMFLMRANPLQGPLEGLGLESWDFFMVLKQLEQIESCSGPKKLRLSWPNSSNGLSNGFVQIRNITYRAISIRCP